MLDENKYPTLRFLRCHKCGHVFVESLAGSTECPECSSAEAGIYRPDGVQDSGQTGENEENRRE
jgi:uncharacterized OB-fold protein